VQIVFHVHKATVSDRIFGRVERALTTLAKRFSRPVRAVVRFEEDGSFHRVEIVLHPARGRNLVAEGSGRYFGPALAAALAHLEVQVNRVRRNGKERGRPLARD
jgi:ribosome-associated translation inhibitor RaiA